MPNPASILRKPTMNKATYCNEHAFLVKCIQIDVPYRPILLNRASVNIMYVLGNDFMCTHCT